MSEKKVVRNTSGGDITVEYGGSHYRFDAGKETECSADLADVAQFRHGHAGLLIVHRAEEAQEAATAAAAAAVETLPVANEDGTPPPPASFTCPHGDFSTNDQVAHLNHLASAHGLSEQQQASAAAAALPDELRTKEHEEESKTDQPSNTSAPESPSAPPAPAAPPASAPRKASTSAAKKPAAKKPATKKEKK
jgi:hypothetical protein